MVFKVIDSLFLNPNLYPQEERIVRIFDEFKSLSVVSRKSWGTSQLYYLERKEQSELLEYIGLQRVDSANVAYDLASSEPEYVQVISMTPSMFKVLSGRAIMGRVFQESDAQAGNDNAVAILTYDWWQTRFGADPMILGRTVTIDGIDHQIVGVMEKAFKIPPASANLQYREGGVITPFVIREEMRQADRRLWTYWGCFALMKPGVSETQLSEELNFLNNTNGEAYPEQHTIEQEREHHTRVWSLGEDLTRDFGSQLALLQVGALVILTIGCVNIAGLTLSRNSARSQELHARLSLGASLGKLRSQLFCESWTLSIIGATAGIGLSLIGLRISRELGIFSGFWVSPRVDLDGRLLAFAFIISIFAALIAGFGSSISTIARGRLNDLAQAGSRSSTQAGKFTKLRSALLFIQVTLATALLVGCGLQIRSYQNVLAIDPGFDPRSVLTATIRLPWQQFNEDEKRLAMLQLEREISALPDVSSVGITNWPPMKMNSIWESYLIFEDNVGQSDYPICSVDTVNNGYFDALNLSLIRGRRFTASDIENRRPVVLIDSTVANKHFGQENPIGKRIAVPRANAVPNSHSAFDWLEVIGVVESIRVNDLYEKPLGMVYRNYTNWLPFWFGLVVKHEGNAERTFAAMRRILDRIAPEVAVGRKETLVQAIAKRHQDRRVLLGFGLMLAAFGLGLCVLGIASLVSYSVAAQRKEIGIRLALGASFRQVQNGVIKRWILISTIAILAGLAIAARFISPLETLLYEINKYDQFAYIISTCVIAASVGTAAFRSVRQITKIDPIIALQKS